MPVLIVLATTVPILRYPWPAASISPLKRMVDAVSEDAWSCTVEMRLEKVAELAAIEETVREPAGFVIAVELS